MVYHVWYCLCVEERVSDWLKRWYCLSLWLALILLLFSRFTDSYNCYILTHTILLSLLLFLSISFALLLAVSVLSRLALLTLLRRFLIDTFTWYKYTHTEKLKHTYFSLSWLRDDRRNLRHYESICLIPCDKAWNQAEPNRAESRCGGLRHSSTTCSPVLVVAVEFIQFAQYH